MVEPSLLQPSLRGQIQPNLPGKTLSLGSPDQGGDIPVLGIGTSHKDTKAPYPNIQTGTSLPFSASHDHIPLTSGSATPSVISICTHSHENPGAGCGEVTPIHTKGCPPPLQELMEECPPEDQTKKQVRVYVEEDLDNGPTLPTDLTTFLVGGTVEEQDNAPCPSIPLSTDP